MTRHTIAAWGAALIAALLWGGYGFLVWQLGESRVRLATRQSEAQLQEERGRSAASLQSLMRDTKEERAALGVIMRTDALAAAATIEAAGRKAGVAVTIDGATMATLTAVQSSDIRAVTLVATAEGEFSALMRAAHLLESLPFPSRLESYELTALDPTKEKKDPWRMTVRIYALIPSESTQ